MNIELVKQIADMVSEQGLKCIEVEEGELRIRVEGQEAAGPAPAAAPSPGPAAGFAAEPAPGDAGVDFNEIHTIVAPMVGLFYAAPSPESEPFVKVEDKVKKGDTICIIEAMKLMNEITADRDGEIIDICVHNGDIVEYGQTIFKMF